MPTLSDIAELGICLNCTGRIFASVGESLDNGSRGQMLIFSLKALEPEFEFHETDPKDCKLCCGILSDFERYYNIVMDELGRTEYSTFLIGSVFDAQTLALESKMQEQFGSLGESIKKEFNREFGKYFSRVTGKEVNFDEPEVTIVVDTRYDYAKTEIRSIYISGRYNKLRRDIPQTRWIHRQDLDDSVEYFIGMPLKSLTGGENFFLHAAGREDVDVRMLGNGRDFVLEITRPEKRDPDLDEVENLINGSNNGVRVSGLEFCSRDHIKMFKGSTFDKTYRALVEAESDFDAERLLTALERISGKVIYQRTPLRVAVRRADLVRERTVRESVLEETHGKYATVLIRAQSGTYIKELVNGDQGRTNPSLSSEYGEKLAVAELDVIEINRGNQ